MLVPCPVSRRPVAPGVLSSDCRKARALRVDSRARPREYDAAGPSSEAPTTLIHVRRSASMLRSSHSVCAEALQSDRAQTP